MNGRRLKSARRLLLGSVLLSCVSGCSIKFAYNNAERLVRWQISEYVELDREQKQYFTEKFTELMDWHRTTQLPEYAQYLYTMAEQYSDQVTPLQIESTFNQFLVWGERIEAKAMPMTIHIMASLSDAQVAELPARLERSNIEIEDAELDTDLESIQRKWAEEFEDTVERFTGRLDIRQRNYIQRKAAGYQPERVLWANYRRRWQADLLALLAQREQADFGPRFIQLSNNREAYYGDEFSRVSEANIELSRDAAAYVLSNLSERQADRLKDALMKLGDDFAELAAQHAEL